MNLSGNNLLVLLVFVLVASVGAQVEAQDFSPLPATAAKATDTPEKIELGKKLFFDPRLSLSGTVSCNTCHNLIKGGDGPALNGWTPSDDAAKFIEFTRNSDSEYVKRFDLDADLGRARATEDSAAEHHFKTPILRNITLTAPYLHNGRVPSLADAIRVMADAQLDVELTDDEVSQLVAFMTALEGEFPNLTLPRLPSRSGNSVIDRPQVSVN